MFAKQPKPPSHYSPSVQNQLSLLPQADQSSVTRTLRHTIRSKHQSVHNSGAHCKNLSQIFSGGPGSSLGIGGVTRHSKSPVENNYDDVASKRIQKRLQLKQLLLNKFKNKYSTAFKACPERTKLEGFLLNKINAELEVMFQKPQYNEADLLEVDARLRTYLKGIITEGSPPRVQTCAIGAQRTKQSSALETHKHVGLLDGQNSFLVKTIDFSENQKMPKFKKNAMGKTLNMSEFQNYLGSSLNPHQRRTQQRNERLRGKFQKSFENQGTTQPLDNPVAEGHQSSRGPSIHFMPREEKYSKAKNFREIYNGAKSSQNNYDKTDDRSWGDYSKIAPRAKVNPRQTSQHFRHRSSLGSEVTPGKEIKHSGELEPIFGSKERVMHSLIHNVPSMNSNQLRLGNLSAIKCKMQSPRQNTAAAGTTRRHIRIFGGQVANDKIDILGRSTSTVSQKIHPEKHLEDGVSAYQLDMVERVRQKKNDQWNKITQFNYKVHQMNLEEAQKKKKQLQAQMRQDLLDQQAKKKQLSTIEAAQDLTWMQNTLNQASKEQVKDDQKAADRKKLMKIIDEERHTHFQEKKMSLEQNKKQLVDFELAQKTKNDEVEKREREKLLQKFQQLRKDAQDNFKQFQAHQMKKKEDHEKEKLYYGGYKEVLNDLQSSNEKMGSPQRDTLFRLVKARESSQTKKEPVFDDIFNNLFDHKTNKPQMLSEKNEARLKAIKKNFNFKQDLLRQQRLEKQMNVDFEKKMERDRADEESRASKRKRLALEAKQFQWQQIEEKKKLKQDKVSTQKAECLAEKEEWELLNKKESEAKEQKASKLAKNQEDLLKQVQEKKQKRLEPEEMTQIEVALNSEILHPADGVPSKYKHLPF